VLANPRSTGFAIQADFPLFLRDLRVEFINIRQWLAGACHHRVGRLLRGLVAHCLVTPMWGQKRPHKPNLPFVPQMSRGSLVTPSTRWYIPFRHNWEPHVTRKPADLVQLKLRFDERLRRRIERAAERNECSMNAEIIKRLEQSFEQVDKIEEFFGGVLAGALGMGEAKTGSRWTDSGNFPAPRRIAPPI